MNGRLLAGVFSLTLSTGALVAQNRVPNADLNDPDGTAGWSLVLGQSLAHDVNDVHECPNSGSALATGLLGVLTIVHSPCAPVVGGDPLDASAWVETSPLLVTLSLQAYSGPGCNAALQLPILPLTDLDISTPGWQELSASGIAAPATAQSARLEVVGAVGVLVSELYIDRVFLGSPGHLFSDDFEGGSTCRWSLAQVD